MYAASPFWEMYSEGFWVLQIALVGGKNYFRGRERSFQYCKGSEKSFSAERDR